LPAYTEVGAKREQIYRRTGSRKSDRNCGEPQPKETSSGKGEGAKNRGGETVRRKKHTKRDSRYSEKESGVSTRYVGERDESYRPAHKAWSSSGKERIRKREKG